MNRDSGEFEIRSIVLADSGEWKRMRSELWPEGVADHAAEIASFFSGDLAEPQAVLVAADPDTRLAGFVELSIRTDIPELDGQRVGYVEGLYLIPEARGRGIARQLLRAARDWAQRSGCTRFASDRADRLIIDRTYRPDTVLDTLS